MNFLAALYILCQFFSSFFFSLLFCCFFFSFFIFWPVTAHARDKKKKEKMRRRGENWVEISRSIFRGDNTRIVGEIRGDTGKIVDKLLTRHTAAHSRFNGRSKIIGKHAFSPPPAPVQRPKNRRIYMGPRSVAPLSFVARKMPVVLDRFRGLSYWREILVEGGGRN